MIGDRIRPALAPTIPLHCSDDFWLACRNLARDHDVRAADASRRNEDAGHLGRKKYGKSLTRISPSSAS